MQLTYLRHLLADARRRVRARLAVAGVDSTSMPRHLEEADRLTARVELGVTGGMKQAIADAADALSAEAGRRLSEADVIRMLLARGLKAIGVSIKRLPGPPPRPPRGVQRRAGSKKKRSG